MDTELFQNIYNAIASKDWFLVAGLALMLVVQGANWALAKWWPSANDTDVKKIAITAALSGLGALATAWAADRTPDVETLKGAIKVWAVAAWAYVVLRKAAILEWASGLLEKWFGGKDEATK